MVFTNQAISLNRLLKQCEELVCEDDTPQWQLDQFVIALEDKYSQVLSAPNCCGMHVDELKSCKRRIDFLRSTVPRVVGVFPTPMLPASAKRSQSDTPAACDASTSEPCTSSSLTASTQLSAGSDSNCAVLSPAVSTFGETLSLSPPSLRFRQNLRRQNEQRKQLLSAANHKSTSSPRSETVNGDSEEMMRKQREAQRRETEQLLLLAQSMKEQSLLAKRIVNIDKETLEKSNLQAERNRVHLQAESSRLSEINNRCCRCWLWLMMAVVCFTFLGMVVFIRLFQK